jgi:hypothetical protein
MHTHPQVRANRPHHKFSINHGHMVSACICRISFPKSVSSVSYKILRTHTQAFTSHPSGQACIHANILLYCGRNKHTFHPRATERPQTLAIPPNTAYLALQHTQLQSKSLCSAIQALQAGTSHSAIIPKMHQIKHK